MPPIGRGIVSEYALGRLERQKIEEVLDSVMREGALIDNPAFLQEARRLAYSSLPERLTSFMGSFARGRIEPVVVISGLSIDAAKIGPTPAHWQQPDRSSTLREELFMVLVASLLGEIFSWATLQEGRIIHNVVPIRGQEYEQSGHSSLGYLAWHTEDAFHPYRCDYLALMALRNIMRTPTQIAAIDSVVLTHDERRVLAQPRFLIRPDKEHLYQVYRESNVVQDQHESLVREWDSPEPVAVLFGNLEHPYLRIDPTFMSTRPGDLEAQNALEKLVAELDASLRDLVIEAGAISFLDNERVVHGRAAFKANYDGRDRWLKKLLVTRDLRKSSALWLDADRAVLRPTARPNPRQGEPNTPADEV